MAVLRKANARSVVICRLTKRSIRKNIYIYPRRKTGALIFHKLLSAYKVLIRRNIM